MERQILLNGQSVRYTLSRKQVKNINLRIRNGEIFVSAAKSVPLSVIEDFLLRKAAWITADEWWLWPRLPVSSPAG